MPGNLATALVSGVFPQMTFVSFVEGRVFPMLTVGYHDHTVDRAVLTDTVNVAASIRTYTLTAKLSIAAIAGFIGFFESHAGGVPFYFYHFYEISPGTPVGSNWRADGLGTQGRHICIFQSAEWSKSYELGTRSSMSAVLREVA